jgi:hypothetical protein
MAVLNILFTCVIAIFFNMFCLWVHKFASSIRIYFTVGLKSSFYYYSVVTGSNFIRIFSCTDSTVVPNTLIHLFLTLTRITVDGRPERSTVTTLVRPCWISPAIYKRSFGSHNYRHTEQSFFRKFSQFIPFDNNIGSYLFFFFGAFSHWRSHVNCITILTNKNSRSKWMNARLLYIHQIYHCSWYHFRGNLNCNCFHFPIFCHISL